MAKTSFTVAASTGPLDELTDERLESVATILERSRRLKGGVVGGNLLSRTLSVRATVDSASQAEAALVAVSELGEIFSRAGIFDEAGIVDFAVMQDLPEDEFASARVDVVGTPDVAARLGISRQRVAQLVEQKGRFPTPLATVRGTHVWRWGDIADWTAAGARDMRRRKPTPEEPDDEIARLTAAAEADRERAARRRPLRAAAKKRIG